MSAEKENLTKSQIKYQRTKRKASEVDTYSHYMCVQGQYIATSNTSVFQSPVLSTPPEWAGDLIEDVRQIKEFMPKIESLPYKCENHDSGSQKKNPRD
jgi:hypothetical protein